MSQHLVPFVAIATAGLCARVHAERVIKITADGAPFAAAELASALRVRLPDGAPVDVRVRPAGDDRVTVAIGDTTRDIALGGRSGADAARLVALEIVDLTLDDLAVMPPSEPVRRTAFAVDVLGSASAWAGVLAGGSVDFVVARGRLAGALEIAAGQRVAGDLHVTSVPLRACLGWRGNGLELRGGVVAAPLWVSDGAGDQTTMFGATASARLRLGRFVLAVGADAYATQTEYRIRMTSITTPWIAPWIAAGMELVP